MFKVLYITNSGGWGGASNALKNIWSQLENRVEISVVFPNHGLFSEYAEKKKYKCYYIKYKHDIWPKTKTLKNKIAFFPRLLVNPIIQYRAYQQLLRIIDVMHPSIIHTNVGPLQFSSKAAYKCNIPHVWHLREYQIKDFEMHPFPTLSCFKKRLGNSFKIVITRDIANYFCLKKNYKVIYDGVISCKNKMPDISFADSNYLLFVGRLEEAKGWKDALSAFITIAEDYPQIRMVFAGTYDESDIKYVRQNNIPQKIQSRIDFLGFRDDCDILMRNARALLVPSRAEGFGFITAEGMYNGCIVIGRDTCGSKEQFDNGFNYMGSEIGLRYKSQDELLIQIKNVLSKPKIFYREMLVKAQRTVFDLYSIEKNAKKVMSIYNELL